ncbi:hypothetical protein HanPI659440_Chr15g0607161 [Helianthus annuus]|nr:hypothetical protein HanPI659440_Chr15g0607161 [Helianthus annuus]
MLCMPIVCVLSTLLYITFSCYVCPLCAYLVHCFTLHFMLFMPIVCILSTIVYITCLHLVQHLVCLTWNNTFINISYAVH